MANRWPDYHKPTPEQATAIQQWFDKHEVPKVLRSVIRKKFCQLNLSPERIAALGKTEFLEATP